jgi:hypothetical protein
MKAATASIALKAEHVTAMTDYRKPTYRKPTYRKPTYRYRYFVELTDC